MQVELYQKKDERVSTQILAILEYGQLCIAGRDVYAPSTEVPEGSEYEYETNLDTISTSQLWNLLGEEKSETELLECLVTMFSGERADIRFQAYCLEHKIETYCVSHFDD